METNDLIDALTADAVPVGRLRPPLVRATRWLVGCAIVVAVISLVHGIRPDLGERLSDPTFALGLLAAASTGVLAGVAAFQLSLPDRSRLWAMLPAPGLIVWFSTIGYGCLTDWVSLTPDGLRWGRAIDCFTTLVVTSIPMWIVLVVMLRRAAPLSPRITALVASLAVAAVTSVGMSLYHDLDFTIMALMWNVGTVALVVGVGRLVGAKMLAGFMTDNTLQRG